MCGAQLWACDQHVLHVAGGAVSIEAVAPLVGIGRLGARVSLARAVVRETQLTVGVAREDGRKAALGETTVEAGAEVSARGVATVAH